MRLCFKLFLVSNLFINFSHGQTGTGRSANYLTGQVQTTEGFTLPGVVVAVIRKDSSLVKVVLSDSSGRFTLPALPAGSFILRSSMMGYKTAYQALQVNDSTSTQFYKLILEPLAVNLSEVKVKEKRPLYELVGDRIILNLASDALFAGGYAYDALGAAPRISIDPISKSVTIDGKTGVILYENGRQQYLSPEQIITYLQSLPVSVINKIEILTNPPASYDAGGSGVILLYTKGLRKDGFTGEVSLAGGFGRYVKANASVNLNLRTARLQGSFMYAPGYKPTYYSWVSDQIITSSNSVNDGLANSKQYNFIDNQSHLIRTNWDWSVAKSVTIGTVIMGSKLLDISTPTSNLIYRLPSQLTENTHIDAITKNSHRIGNLAINIHALKKLADKKSSLSADVDFDQYRDRTTAQSEFTQLLPESRPTESFLIRYPSQITIRTGKIDFSRTVSKNGLLEVGLKHSNIDMQNLPSTDYLTAGFKTLQPLLSRAYTYSEKTSSAYVSASNSWKLLSVQAGLRLEHTNYAGVSDFITPITWRYTNLFPTLSLKYTSPSKAQLSISVNRRIVRPTFNSLNPAYVFIDPLTLYSGNPLLVPQLTTSLQASYTTPKRASLTILYSDSRNRMAEVVYRFDSSSATTLDQFINFDWERRASAVVAIPMQVTSFWMMQASVTAAHSQFYATFADRPTRTEQTTAIVRLNNTLNLKKCSASVNLTYRNAAVVGYMIYDPLYYVDLGCQRSIGKQATLKLSASDSFHTLLITNYGKYLNTNIIFRHRYESQRLMVTYSWRFGSKNGGQSKLGSFGSDVEQERLGTGYNN